MHPGFPLHPQLHPPAGGKSDPQGQAGVRRGRHLLWTQNSREYPNPHSSRSIRFDTKFKKKIKNKCKKVHANTSQFYKNRLFGLVCFTLLRYSQEQLFPIGYSSQASVAVTFLPGGLWGSTGMWTDRAVKSLGFFNWRVYINSFSRVQSTGGYFDACTQEHTFCLLPQVPALLGAGLMPGPLLAMPFTPRIRFFLRRCKP